MNEEQTTIRVNKSTRDVLASVGGYGDSMDTIIRMLLQAYDNNITFEDYK